MRATLLCAVLFGALVAVPAVGADDPPITKEDLKISENNLKQIGIAFHAYHDSYTALPGDILDKNGKPLLSWRVAILPFVEQTQLYQQFKLDEPWDSEHNKALIKDMPKLYAPIRVKAKAGETFYQGFYGPSALFDPKAKPRTLAAIANQNGASYTAMVVEAGESTVWTKPGGIPFDAEKELPKLGGLFDGEFHVLFCDGHVSMLKKDADQKELKKIVMPSNGDTIDFKKLEK
jgi:prepilin-type processing-associated H-X9-DG protein